MNGASLLNPILNTGVVGFYDTQYAVSFRQTGVASKLTKRFSLSPMTSSLRTFQPRALAQTSRLTACLSSSLFHPPSGVVGLTAGKPFVGSNFFLLDSTSVGV